MFWCICPRKPRGMISDFRTIDIPIFDLYSCALLGTPLTSCCCCCCLLLCGICSLHCTRIVWWRWRRTREIFASVRDRDKCKHKVWRDAQRLRGEHSSSCGKCTSGSWRSIHWRSYHLYDKRRRASWCHWYQRHAKDHVSEAIRSDDDLQ